MELTPMHGSRTVILAAAALVVVASVGRAQEPAANAGSGSARLPVCFVENRGQLDPAVRFVVHGAERTVFFTRTGVTLSLRHGDTDAWAVKLSFVGARPEATLEGRARDRGVVSYFRGERSSWVGGAASYREIVYRGLWPGIDLAYSIEGRTLKYAFHVRPGADPSRIRVACRGAEASIGADGRLILTTGGAGVVSDEAPVSYQPAAGGGRPVASGYRVLDGGRAYGFRVGRYDPTRPLVIDPVTLAYCGYVGGYETDRLNGIAVDTSGHVYVAGYTGSTEATFPVKTGPMKTYSGAADVVVAKLAPDGRSFVYCGYIGGAKWEYARGIAVDGSGCAYIVGDGDGGPGYPYKNGPPYTGPHFAFVTKINAAGTDLVYSGFIGGQEVMHATGIAVDAAGAAYVCGYTYAKAESVPVKVGPDLTPNGAADCWVAKVHPSGRELEYCGFLGGALRDFPARIAVDGKGRAYLTGLTYSDEKTFPVKVGPVLAYYNEDPPSPITGDAFIARVNAAGTGLDYCGYIGGYGHDKAWDVAVDAEGAAYVTGTMRATETTLPVKVGPGLVHGGGGSDAFVAKVDPTGKAFDYLGFIGGDGGDSGWAITVDAWGAAWVAGSTSGGTFPERYGPKLGGQFGRMFVAKVAPSGATLESSGTIGGWGGDHVTGIGVDGSGNAYITGHTFSDEKSFPVRVGPDLTYNDTGRYCPCGDGFVAKIVTTRMNVSGTTRPGGTVSFTLLASDDADRAYRMASSLGKGPIPIDTRRIDLGYDGILWISLSGLVPGTFVDYSGTIGSDGRAKSALVLPPLPVLVGTTIHTAFVTLDAAAPSGIRSIADTESFTIVAK